MIQNMKCGHKMRSFILMNLYICTVFANNIDSLKKIPQIKDNYSIYNSDNKSEKILKTEKDLLKRLKIKVSGSITIQHSF